MKPATLFGLAVLGAGLLVLVGRGGDVRAEGGAAAGGEAVSLRVCGLQVTAKGYGVGDDMIQPLNAMGAGTTVAVMASASKGRLLDFMESDSKVTKFADDKGANLLAGKGEYWKPGFNPQTQLSKDGKAMLLEIRATTRPAAGATQVLAEGEAAFLYSASGGRKTDKVENVELKKGTKVTAGSLTLVVSEAGKPGYGDDPMRVAFTSEQNVRALASVKFLDADGKEIESRQNSTGRMEMGGKVTYDVDYMLKQKVDKATMVIETWSDATTVKVPVSLKVGVGL